MLINVKNRYVVSLFQLLRLAFVYVYDKKHMSGADEKLMQKSIVHWSNKVDMNEEELHQLQRIAKFLKSDEEGKLEDRKELFKKHKINWAKFHRVPDIEELGRC